MHTHTHINNPMRDATSGGLGIYNPMRDATSGGLGYSYSWFTQT